MNLTRRVPPTAALLLALATPLTAAGFSDPPELRYTVRIPDPATGVVEVELRLSGLAESPAELELALPRRFAYVTLDEPLLEGELEAYDGGNGALLVERVDPFRWTVHRGASDTVRARLRVPLEHREIPEVLERDAYEFPYLAEDHGMLVAGTLFPLPVIEDPRAAKVDVGVRFELPEGWAVHCPWPESEPGVFTPTDPASLHDDLLAIGDWDEEVIDAGGCEVTLAIAPGQPELIEAIAPLIERIVRAELTLFGRVPREKYLFLFGRPDPPFAPGEHGLSMGGSPKRGSMTLFLRGLPPGGDPAKYLGHLIAHEFHHTWTSSLETPDELRFFAEGFTDYYAYLLLAREGLSTWEAFARTLGGKLRDYLKNPRVGELSLSEAGGPRFFEGGPAYSLVYDGGLLLAALVDRRIRAKGEGRSLDEMMRMFNNERRGREANQQEIVKAFREVLTGFLSPAEAEELWGLITGRDPIDFVELLTATGAEIETRTGAASGSMRANLDGTRIVDLDPNGLAGRLGLLAGDLLLVVNGVECSDAREVRRAWRAPRGTRMVLCLQRDGERIEIDERVPEELVVKVDPAPWREHTATPVD